MSILGTLIVVLYTLGLSVIFIYTLAQLHLVYYYLKEKAQKKYADYKWSEKTVEEHPMVTIQLPVYNERYVVNRLIDAVSAFNWPKEKMEIQVLDDSTDETVEIIAEKVEKLQQEGVLIEHVRRDSREGFKAGALQYGMERAKGKFIAIFDADFVPKPEFLHKTVHHFENEEVGLVQTRWGHLNQNFSLLTRVQAFALNAHFTVEQKGRNNAGFFMNFNGTAGIWRKTCIEDAGGWHHDTLTEDLDLSYRAQLKDWKFKYLESVVSPAELPVAMSALKTQQYRWTKGSAETARKHLPNVWNTELPLIKRIQASSHLLSSGIFFFILLISVLSVPLLGVKEFNSDLATFFKAAGFFLVGLVFWIIFYGSSIARDEDSMLSKAGRLTIMFPVFLTISMGLAVHNSIAALKGYLREDSPFIRTPKFNVVNVSDSWKDNKYLVNEVGLDTWIEGALTLYFLGGIIAAFLLNDFALAPFHLMLFLGFGTIFGTSVYETYLKLA